MTERLKNWSEAYKFVYNIFLQSDFPKEFGANKLGLARCLGASQGKTQKWEKGQWPTASDLEVIALRFGLSYRWLVTGEGDPFGDETASSNQPGLRALRPVPMVGLASCGVEGWNQVMPIAVSASPLMQGENMVAVIAAGESMVPAGIASGQVCYCDPDQPVLEGDAVYLERVDGMATIKLYLGEGERAGTIQLKGWHPADAEERRMPFTVELPREQVAKIAPVIYVRRRL